MVEDIYLQELGACDILLEKEDRTITKDGNGQKVDENEQSFDADQDKGVPEEQEIQNE